MDLAIQKRFMGNDCCHDLERFSLRFGVNYSRRRITTLSGHRPGPRRSLYGHQFSNPSLQNPNFRTIVMADERTCNRRWLGRPLKSFWGMLEPWSTPLSNLLCSVSLDHATHELRDALTQRVVNKNLELTDLNLSEAIVYQKKLYAAERSRTRVRVIQITTGETLWTRTLENAAGVCMHGSNIHIWSDAALFDVDEREGRVSFVEILPLSEKFRSLCILRRSSHGISYAAETFDDTVKLNYQALHGNGTRTLHSMQNCSLLGSYDERVYAVPTIGESQLIEINGSQVNRYGFVGDFRSKIVGETLFSIHDDRPFSDERVVNISTKNLESLSASRKEPVISLERCVVFPVSAQGNVVPIPSYH